MIYIIFSYSVKFYVCLSVKPFVSLSLLSIVNCLNMKMLPYQYRIPIIRIRWSHDNIQMTISIPWNTVFTLKWVPSVCQFFLSSSFSSCNIYFTIHLSLSLSLVLSLSLFTWLLNHWGWVTHICISKLIIIGSDNGLSPIRHQAIISTNAGLLLIRPLETNFSEILIEIHTFSFKKIHMEMFAKWRPFCLGLNVLIELLLHMQNFYLFQSLFFM